MHNILSSFFVTQFPPISAMSVQTKNRLFVASAVALTLCASAYVTVYLPFSE